MKKITEQDLLTYLNKRIANLEKASEKEKVLRRLENYNWAIMELQRLQEWILFDLDL